jgi:molybdate transport system substrate-binding protein
MKHRISAIFLAVVVALTLASPALGMRPAKAAKAAPPKLIVYGAASLSNVFPAMVPTFKKAYPKYKNAKFIWNFQGTDTLVAQIQAGAPCDVFAGASTKYGNQLFSGGFINQPVNFCQNKLVVIIPKSNPARIHVLQDLARTKPTVMIAIGDASVPIGTYTRTVLTNFSKSPAYGADYSTKVLANVVANCTNVNAVTALVVIREVDAGFVYKSDAQFVSTRVQQITIPNAFQTNPLPTYPIAVTKSSTKAAFAQSWQNFVMSKKGQAIMLKYGFLPKPAATP